MTPVLQITGVEKRYQSLRPLRIQELTIAAAERVAVSGFDAGAAEVLVNLVTGASLPDRGEVRVLGHRTADIVGGDEWLASLDRFGIVSPRGVLLEAATIEQNLAMPLTLEIDPVPPDVAARVVDLARQCGIIDLTWRGRRLAADYRGGCSFDPCASSSGASDRAPAGAAGPGACGCRSGRGRAARACRLYCWSGGRRRACGARDHQR